MRRIADHVFRGQSRCLYPVPSRIPGEGAVCGRPEQMHKESADGRSRPSVHLFIGLRRCAGCGLGFDHPGHYFSPSRRRFGRAQ
jgi:hypothetical protein